MKPLALVVDDERQMTQIVSFALETAGFDTVIASDGNSAWQMFKRRPVDLVVLDVMMPDISGATLARRIRAQASTPIIMLTALGDVEQRVAGLEAGADDYIAKPFSPQELILRAKAVVRRTVSAVGEESRKVGPFEFGATGDVLINGQNAGLTEIESKLLRVLIHHKDEVMPQRTLLNEVWDTTSSAGGRNMVKTTVYRLRKKITASGLPENTIQSIRGRGYTISW